MDDLGVKVTSDLIELGKLMKIYPEINESTTSIEKISPRLLVTVKKMKVKSNVPS